MKSLYSRVFWITVATVIVSSLLGFLLSNIYYHVKLKPFNDEKLVKVAGSIQTFAEQHQNVAEPYLKSVADSGYEIFMTDGLRHEQYYGGAFRERDLTAEAIQQVLKGTIYHGVGQFPNKLFVTGFFDNRLSNTIGVPLMLEGKAYALFIRPDVLLQFGELRIFFALILGFAVLFSILFFLLSTRYLVKPITKLTEATKRIAQGQYNLALPGRRRDEIGQLAANFTIMSKDLERVEQSRQEFVSNVSHEIQSPLTSIQGFAQALNRPEITPDEYSHYASIITEEARHLSLLSKQLLQLSSLDQAAHQLVMKSFKLRPQLRQIVQALEWQLSEKSLSITIEIPEDMCVCGDEVLLSQVWTNLLSNAVKYIPEGRSIRINGSEAERMSIIEVADTGEGIDEEQQKRLFDRFYKGDASRERASGSAGLGLSIVKKIIQLHEGTIEVKSRVGYGTTFIIKLPMLKPN